MNPYSTFSLPFSGCVLPLHLYTYIHSFPPSLLSRDFVLLQLLLPLLLSLTFHSLPSIYTVQGTPLTLDPRRNPRPPRQSQPRIPRPRRSLRPIQVPPPPPCRAKLTIPGKTKPCTRRKSSPRQGNGLPSSPPPEPHPQEPDSLTRLHGSFPCLSGDAGGGC